jgi:hypothetical protein
MASNLAGATCIGQHSVCILRAAKLDADCSPRGGADSGIITTGIVTMTASPDIEEGTQFEPKTGCGDIGWTYEEADRIKRFNLSGEILFHDWELMEVLFGGALILGGAGSDYPGKVIGWAAPSFTDAPTSGVYLEVITKNVGQGVGDCSSATTAFPTYQAHAFGKVRLAPGDRTFENDVASVTFTGKATSNPNLFDGPWNDYPGVGYMPNKPYMTWGYSTDEYNAIAALASCGYKTLPAAS